MPANSGQTRRSSTWVTANSGNIYYRARTSNKKSNSAGRFPRPLIEPRRSRPHAIHIVTYPPGYVPRELRPEGQCRPETSSRSRKNKVRAARAKKRNHNHNDTHPSAPANSDSNSPSDRSPIRPVLGKILGSFQNITQITDRRLSVFSAHESPVTDNATGVPTSPDDEESDVIRQVAEPDHHQSAPQRSQPLIAHARSATVPSIPTANLPTSESTFSASTARDSTSAQVLARASSDTAAIPTVPRPRLRSSNTTSLALKRTSLMSVRSAKSAVSSLITEVPKPVASGSGVSCSILLAEPNIFLSGFDHDGHVQREGQGGTALLRGKMQLNVSKNVKIKAIQLKLVGRARTEWPEGIPPLKQDMHEEQGLRTQVLTFFNAMNDGWETEYGNQCSYKLKNPSGSIGSATTYLVVSPTPPGHQRSLSARDLKRLSLQNAQSRSFGKGDSGTTTPTQAKGFKIFYPGTYDYSFELPIDHHQLETIKLQYGSVKWELQASIDRAGAFKPNLNGSKEVSIIRIPDQMSLEMSEPISISRQWEDQLHYDIIISGKSFPIGGRIPIAFKLTPLAKVQVHKLKVFVTESIEYWTNDKRVTRKDPGRKILLLEKSAGKPLDPAWASSEMRTVRGGELTQAQRREARDIASRRRSSIAQRRQVQPQPLPEPTENLLGDLDLGLESYWGSTEIEANVQIPTCETMAKNKDLRLNPDCSWKNVNVYHWIKIVMRISRLDPEDPTGTKRRHFEISIDSPFTVLNCRATQANTVLPAYTGNQTQGQMYQSSCGCPDATIVPAEASPNSSTGTLAGTDRSSENLPAMPQAAHLTNMAANPASEPQTQVEPRPIHLLRAPSFNPPAFDEDTAPPPAVEMVDDSFDMTRPPAETPPPQYDIVVGTPSVDGLADYFSRLAEHDNDHESGSDSDESPPRILERSGRVNVAHPHTPGGRMLSRSMELSRPAITLNMPRPPNRTTQAAT